MIRVFTPLWILFYLALTPLIALKYTIDLMFLFLSDKVFDHLEPGLSTFKRQQHMFAAAGYWMWACVFYPLIYGLVVMLSVLYRTWMLFYQTYHMCRFRGRYNGHVRDE